MKWGLVLSWAPDRSIGDRMINARAETETEKPSFNRLLRQQRCLIPADGFYEWRRGGNSKVPVWIHLEKKEPFAFAGLWIYGVTQKARRSIRSRSLRLLQRFALQPLVGDATGIRFAIGIIAVGFLAVPIMTTGAAYDLCQSFGWKEIC